MYMYTYMTSDTSKVFDIILDIADMESGVFDVSYNI